MTTYIKANTRSSQVVTTTGDDANGGLWAGQQSGNGVNRAMSDDAYVVIDGSTIVAESVDRQQIEFTSGYDVSLDDVGNGGWYHIASGSHTGYYAFGPITSVDLANNRGMGSNLNGPWHGRGNSGDRRDGRRACYAGRGDEPTDDLFNSLCEGGNVYAPKQRSQFLGRPARSTELVDNDRL